MSDQRDIQRLREEYAARKRDAKKQNLYAEHNPAHQFSIKNRTAALQSLLKKHQLEDLSGKRILEMGCGSGGVLREICALGADESRLVGVDLLMDSLRSARTRLSDGVLLCADGQSLPFPAASFDLALQFTAFSSILDPGTRQRMAAEMLRLLKPAGALIWYDFWWNPLNKQTKGIGLSEIRTLFPGCVLDSLKITLAPPLARLLLPRFGRPAACLERMRLLNTHYLVILRRKP